MPIEIERKFLLKNDHWRKSVEHTEHIAQGYLAGAQAIQAGVTRCSVRIRIAGEQAWLNIKSANAGIARQEYEYLVPLAEAQLMLEGLTAGSVEKLRHHVRVEGILFEVDEFLGTNNGLILAEVELPSLDASHPVPGWLGREVSDEGRYYNINLIHHPYTQWTDKEGACDLAQ